MKFLFKDEQPPIYVIFEYIRDFKYLNDKIKSIIKNKWEVEPAQFIMEQNTAD